MSLIQKIKEMSAQSVSASAVKLVEMPTADEVEAKLRRKAGVLAAFGLSDKAIADTLFISLEQVSVIKETVEYKESCAKQTQERTQRLIDLEEGWDSVETMGVGKVLQHMQYMNDPEFALRAAIVANKAARRTPASLDRVIDASKVGHVITLTVNKNYVAQVTNNDSQSHGFVDAQARPFGEMPRKASDVSSPKRLSEILQVEDSRKKEQEIIKMAEAVGISIDELDEILPT